MGHWHGADCRSVHPERIVVVMEDFDKLVERGASIKKHIMALTEELRTVNEEIAKAVVKNGSRSAAVYTNKYKVTVQLRNNVKWDQDRLFEVSKHAQFNEKFYESFRSEYKPNTRVMEAYMAENTDFANAINWARTVTAGAPSVTYTAINVEGEYNA